MAVNIAIVKKRLDELIFSKSQNDEKLLHLDEQAEILRKKLHLDSN